MVTGTVRRSAILMIFHSGGSPTQSQHHDRWGAPFIAPLFFAMSGRTGKPYYGFLIFTTATMSGKPSNFVMVTTPGSSSRSSGQRLGFASRYGRNLYP